jgi:predicted nucleic acid-binding protein
VFVDTSALSALLDRDDRRHGDAAARWSGLLDDLVAGALRPVTHSSVVVETSALVQHRLGIPALRDLHADLLPVLEVTGVDDDLHRRAVSALLGAGRRDVSLVDWTSFELMRTAGIAVAFAFDDDFADQGFAAYG